MKKRVITATILCCVLLPVLFFGSYLMIALTMFLSFMGVYELVKMYNINIVLQMDIKLLYH